ncbi:uncharacterized protein LTR77_003962 [Saxophila tyrrhenica]|uniref:Uncharacterized protein n=1 Tax=Saxophila tyrrhenica TaxID=1690608 RepID=A0AAV9PFT8_9PEZI|nr:hypothetical protein LTR77_003962 [Saxophila tyrrhenica]
MAYNHATSTYILIFLTIIFGLVGGYVMFFGIPPELKSWLQEEALEYMGENKASYLAKAGIDAIPEGDQKVAPALFSQFWCRKGRDLSANGVMQELKQARNKIKQMGGGALQNPLGKFAGDAGDDMQKDFTKNFG